VISICKPPSPLPSSLAQSLAQHLFLPPPPINPATLILKYKRVDKKVRPIPTTLPEEFRNLRRIPEDPLLSLPPLPTHPPDFMPGERLTQECLDKLALNPDNFLWLEEVKLFQHILKLNESALVWTEAERGSFSDAYFSPIKIPVIEHVPWAHKNLPIPPGMLKEVIKLFCKKVASGIYKPSDSSYRLRWFCVKKKSSTLHMSQAVLAPPSLSYKPVTSASHDRGNISHDPTHDSSRDPFATHTSRDSSAHDPGNLRPHDPGKITHDLSRNWSSTTSPDKTRFGRASNPLINTWQIVGTINKTRPLNNQQTCDTTQSTKTRLIRARP